MFRPRSSHWYLRIVFMVILFLTLSSLSLQSVTLTPFPGVDVASAAALMSGPEDCQAVTWVHKRNVVATGNTIEKTAGGSAWNAGAASSVGIQSGSSGHVEATVASTSHTLMFGLSRIDKDAHWQSLDYAFYIDPAVSGGLTIIERGAGLASYGAYAAGDVLRVAVEGTSVRYYRNGNLLYTSLVAPTFPLYMDSSIWNSGGKVQNAQICGGSAPAPLPTSTCEAVTWVHTRNAMSTGNTVQKTAGGSGWNAGAASSQAIQSGNSGYVRATIASGIDTLMFGLSHQDSDVNWTSLDYAFYIDPGVGVLSVQEKGNTKALWSMYDAGDELTIAVDQAGVVRYYLNNQLVYTSTAAPTYPLYMDSSIWNVGGKVQNAQICGASAHPALPQSPCDSLDGAWTGKRNVSAAGNTITKVSGGSAWNAGGASRKGILSGRGYVQMTVASSGDILMFGLSNSDIDVQWQSIDYAFYIDPYAGKLQIVEKGTNRGGYGLYDAGDTLRVAVDDTQIVRYYKNGELLYTSTVAPKYPLFLDSSLYTSGSKVQDASLCGASLTEPISTSNCQPVTWTGGQNATPTGNTLAKTAGGTGWNAGAISSAALQPGSTGYVRATVASTQDILMFGLSDDPSNNVTWQNLDYAFYIDPGTSGLTVAESGTTKGAVSLYDVGDELAIGVGSSGLVRYYRNGVAVYTSTVTAPSAPLYMDSSLYNTGSKVQDAYICNGVPGATPTPTFTATSTSTSTPTSTPTSTNTATPSSTPATPAAGEDVFLGKPAWDGNECFGGCANMAGNAVDNNSTTYWGARSNSWRVDVGQQVPIVKITFFQDGNYATAVDIVAGTVVGCDGWGICDTSDPRTIKANVAVVNGWNEIALPGDAAYRMYSIVATAHIGIQDGWRVHTIQGIMGTPPPPPPPDDVFLGKRAWDGAECFGGCAYMAGNATDGNEATIWGARSDNWRVDLTTPTNVGTIRLYQEGNYATTIDIRAGNQVSCDQWGICGMSDAQTITSAVTLTGGWNTVTLPGDSAYRMYQIVATAQSGTGQWAVSSAQGFALPTPPKHTTSYYIQSADPADARLLGCEARQRGETGLVVLDFGGPYIQSVSSPPGVEYGARLIVVRTLVSLAEVQAIAREFALGYTLGQGCQAPNTVADLTIVLGVSNTAYLADGPHIWQDNMDLNYSHGAAWAGMVSALRQEAASDPYLSGAVSFAGGYDFEYYASTDLDCRDTVLGERGPCPNVNADNVTADPDRWSRYRINDSAKSGTKYWAEGFTSIPDVAAFNFGSCEGCPRGGSPTTWAQSPLVSEALNRVYYVSYGLVNAWPLPQIYLTPYMWEWYNVKWYAKVHQGSNMRFLGAMSGCAVNSTCAARMTSTPARFNERFNDKCTTQNGADCTGNWQPYSCTSGAAGGAGCPYLPPHRAWQALTDMLSSPHAPLTGSPTAPQKVPNPLLEPQSILQYGVTDIIYP